MFSSALGTIRLGMMGLGQVPSGGGVTLSPPAGSLTLSPGTPLVIVPVTLSPAAGSLTLTPGTPVLAIPVLLAPAAGTLTLSPDTPVVIVPKYLFPASGSLTLTPGTPRISMVSTGVYRYVIEGADPTQYAGPKLPPVDPAPTIGHYGYEDFD